MRWAVSLGVLLGTFMGGMCVGSIMMPRLISEKYHPLRVYACLEIGIAVCGLLIFWGVPLMENVYAGLGLPHGASRIFWRAVVAVMFLLPPTILKLGTWIPSCTAISSGRRHCGRRSDLRLTVRVRARSKSSVNRRQSPGT